MSDGFLSFYLDDDGVAKKVPDYQITICFETEEEMNRFSEKMKNEDKYAWHDLRKNPEDLPEENDHNRKEVIMERTYSEYKVLGHAIYMDISGGRYWLEDDKGYLMHPVYKEHKGGTSDLKVIAWREIEPFEGSEE